MRLSTTSEGPFSHTAMTHIAQNCCYFAITLLGAAWHFLIVQLYHMASQIQGCIVGAQTMQFHDELVTDIGGKHPSCQWPSPESQICLHLLQDRQDLPCCRLQHVVSARLPFGPSCGNVWHGSTHALVSIVPKHGLSPIEPWVIRLLLPLSAMMLNV
jgi:hypothetical protein